MTESVKFPGTDIEAPKIVNLDDIDDDYGLCGYSVREKWENELTYLRADTATPNDQVVDMMREAINDATSLCVSHMLGYPPAGVAIDGGIEEWERQKNNIIEAIRSRYAASDSD